MKKTVALVSALLCLAFGITAFAECENIPIADFAEYLTEEQYNELSAKIDTVREKYDFDIAVYTEEKMSGEEAQGVADDIFDYCGYGAGKNADGMLLYIASSPRVYHFSTHGSGEKFFNDNGLAYLEKKLLPHLKENDYYTAIKLYAKYSEELLETAAQGKPFDKKQYSTEYLCCVIGGALLLPLLLAYLMTKLKLGKMKTAVKNDCAANYIKRGSMRTDMSKDVFLYSTVVKTARQKSSSGGHTSSSGEHHGGRGGSY